MNIAILSGRYPNTSFESASNHKIYADHYGYTYIHCNWATGERNRYFNKIRYIEYYFGFFDYIIWLDDDAFFWNMEQDIMQYLPKGDHFISLCESPSFKTLKTHFSSGQFIIKTNELAKEFLTAILSTDIQLVKKWWNIDLGYFSNGDQDIMIYLSLSDKRFINGLKLYNYKKFNSRVQNLKEKDIHHPLILHFTGTVQIKNKDYKWVQKQFNLHPSLVSKNITSKYQLFSNPKKVKFKIRVLKKIKVWLRS